MAGWLRRLASRIRGWQSSDTVDREFEQEMETHLELLAEENVRRGMPLEEARRAAHVRLGGVTQLKETNRDLRGLPLVEGFAQDVRYAFRMLRRNPGFTAVAVLTLALGIGANTAMFSVVYAVLLKPLPYPSPERLVTVFQVKPSESAKGTAWSYPHLQELREQNTVFSELGGCQHHRLTLTGHGEPTVVNTSVVTGEFFLTFGEAPRAGRIFTPADGRPGAPAVAVLSESLWRRKFAADPGVVGSSIDLDKKPFTVIGVMPASFTYPLVREREQVWIPLPQDPLYSGFMPSRDSHWLEVEGRLKPGISLQQAQAELDGLNARFAKEFPSEYAGWTIRILPLQQVIAWDVKPALLVLLGAVGLVLLIACANIVNLLLARATSRAKEMALRSTLGAARGRIVRQLLTESAVLCLVGGAAGITLAYWGVRGLSALLPWEVPNVNEIRIDFGVLSFALIGSALTSVAVGLVPALFTATTPLPASLREGSARTGESAAGRRARNFFAAAEIALAVVLLSASGLLLRSFSKLTSVNPGFEATQLVKATYSLPREQYATPNEWAAFARELLPRIQAEPGMQDSAAVVPLPITDRQVTIPFEIEGNPSTSAGASRTADFATVSPEYFRVMGVPLVAGRLFDEHDGMEARRVTIISRAMARTYFPNENPLGKRISFGLPTIGAVAAREIVGIVGDVRNVSLGAEPGPMMYVPYAQFPFWGAELVVRSTLNTAGVAAALRREAGAVDKDVPITDVETMAEVVDDSVAEPRARTFLIALFAAMALVLAASGIFGVISYSVACRTNEIGIRMALGASRTTIVRMVSRETALLAFAGLALGIPAALAANRLLGHMLYGVTAHDPATLSGVAFALVAVAGVAACAPVRRAMLVDPMVALRHE